MEHPDFKILISLIEVWRVEDNNNPLAEPPSDALWFVTDIANLEIVESYQKLISTAQITFPKGTVIKKTITTEEREDEGSITIGLSDAGVVQEIRTSTEVLSTQFSVGNRIRISLGYTSDPKIAALTRHTTLSNIYNTPSKLTEYRNHLTVMFNGYIAKCSIDIPITIKCENLAYGLKRITCPDYPKIPNATVNDLLATDGKYKLLEGTGIELYPKTSEININLGDIGINPHMTIADMLNTWSKRKLYTFLKEENNRVYLVVGRIYTQDINVKDNILALCNNNSTTPVIDFKYNVAENHLTVMKTEAMFIACEASFLPQGSNQFYRVTIRRNPNNLNEYQLLNETKITKNKQKAGLEALNDVSQPVDLSNYTVVSYIGNPNDTQEKVIEDAKKYLESYNQNGIEGSLTLFGDLALRTGAEVELKDELYPNKNGVYLVEEVRTTFGVDGYRQTIKLPYCLSRNNG